MSRSCMTLTGLLLILVGALLVIPSHSGLVPEASLVSALVETGEYTYYGWVPSRIYRNLTRHYAGATRFLLKNIPPERDWVVSPESIRERALLTIVGGHDNTAVSVYQLPDGLLVKGFTVNRFEKVEVSLPNGTFFKVVSTRPATAMLLGGVGLDGAAETLELGCDQSGISTFLTSIDGGYVSREFIFTAVEVKPATPQRVFALEESQVTIWDAEAEKATEFKLPVNGVREFSLPALHVYRLESTGRVMLQTFHIGDKAARSCAYPTPTGGFLGKTFYGSGAELRLYSTPWLNYVGERAFTVTTAEDTSLRVIDLPNRKVLLTEAIAAGNKSFQVDVPEAVIEVGSPTLLMFKSGDVEGGLTFTGLRGGQTAQLLVPEGESYLFTAEETDVTVDDVRLSLRADGILSLTPGLRKISASENVVVEVMNLKPDQGLGMFGACIPSTQSLSLTSEGLTLKSLLEEQTPLLYYALAIVTIAAIVSVFALRRRTRKPPPAQRP